MLSIVLIDISPKLLYLFLFLVNFLLFSCFFFPTPRREVFIPHPGPNLRPKDEGFCLPPSTPEHVPEVRRMAPHIFRGVHMDSLQGRDNSPSMHASPEFSFRSSVPGHPELFKFLARDTDPSEMVLF